MEISSISLSSDLLDPERHMLIDSRPVQLKRCYVHGCEMRAVHIEGYALIRPLADYVLGLCDAHFLDSVEAISLPARPPQGPYPWSPV